MADDSLKEPVSVQALGINASSLPAIFSRAYQNYVLNQTLDFVAVAGKANESGQGAYDAQVKNDEQDIALANHEGRITAAEVKLVNHEIRIAAAEATLVNHETRITSAEAALVNHEGRITTLEGDVSYLLDEVADHETRLTTAESDIGALETNSISKAVSTSQSVQATGGSFLVGSIAAPTTDKLQVSGSVNVGVSYKVAGLQVIGTRQTGWTAGTGTEFKGTFNADQIFTASPTYTQADIQALCDALKEARQRILALEQSYRTHGMID